MSNLNPPLDVICQEGESETNVTIRAGVSYNYRTSDKGKYDDEVYCIVNYFLHESCAEMSFACKRLIIKNREEDCSDGDSLIFVTEEEEEV